MGVKGLIAQILRIQTSIFNQKTVLLLQFVIPELGIEPIILLNAENLLISYGLQVLFAEKKTSKITDFLSKPSLVVSLLISELRFGRIELKNTQKLLF